MSECEGCKALRERVEKLCDKIDLALFSTVTHTPPAWIKSTTTYSICGKCGISHKSDETHVCITCSPYKIESTAP